MTRALVPTRLHQLLRPRRSLKHVGHASLSSSACRLAAHEFTMPAMSPTMTEGNITSWKVQEGASYTAGDVLLEIETDKAQMDVEAQDDGILAKIMQPDGSKSVKVGTRIAVTADAGDDLESLDISTLKSQERTQPVGEENNEASSETVKPEGSASSSTKSPVDTAHGESSKQSPHNLKYPMYPSVIQLLHERGISQDDTAKMPASGPNGRLLKGDVLAFLGEIASSYPREQASRIADLGHLDLSNIELAPRKQSSDSPASRTVATEVPKDTQSISEVALPISLAAVQSVRQKIKRVLGVDVTLETFIARATRLCNDGLPRSRNESLSADELFDAVLGLDKIPASSNGSLLIPQIQTTMTEITRPNTFRSLAPDIIDELTGGSMGSATRKPIFRAASKQDPTISLFSVVVPSGDEKRARVFLERLKTTLQVEPGRLVL